MTDFQGFSSSPPSRALLPNRGYSAAAHVYACRPFSLVLTSDRKSGQIVTGGELKELCGQPGIATSRKSILLARSTDPRLDDLDLLKRPILRPSLDQPHPLHYLHSTLHPPENGMFPIQPWRRCQRDKELTPIGIRTTVRHTQNTSSSMLERGMNLIFELVTVDGASATTGASRVAGLDHEVRDDAMKDDTIVVTTFCKSGEVLAGFRSVIVVKFDGDGALILFNEGLTKDLSSLTIVVSNTMSVVILATKNVIDFRKIFRSKVSSTT
jgi:hypothetical protein